jgi:hypothetical protein
MGWEVKGRNVCCNRDIAKTRTEMLVDWGPEFQTRAHGLRDRELKG